MLVLSQCATQCDFHRICMYVQGSKIRNLMARVRKESIYGQPKGRKTQSQLPEPSEHAL